MKKLLSLRLIAILIIVILFTILPVVAPESSNAYSNIISSSYLYNPLYPNDPYVAALAVGKNYVGDTHVPQYGPFSRECVEYVDRFYKYKMGYPNAYKWSGNGYEYFTKRVGDAGLKRFRNGVSKEAPKAKDILCFGGGSNGHVAIVLSATSSYVKVIQQNWPYGKAAIYYFPAHRLSNGAYYVSNSGRYYCQGWLRDKKSKTSISKPTPKPPPTPKPEAPCDDVAIFYERSSGTCVWSIWLSAGGGFNYHGSSGWWASDSYDASCVKGRVSGDFNGDGKTDLAALYRRSSGTCIWHVWLSSGDGLLYQGSSGWWASDSYDGTKIIKTSSGDFNGDGKDDVAAFYQRASGTCIWHVWLSAGDGFRYQGSSGWWALDGYDTSGIQDVTAGDYNGDGKTDTAILYLRSSGTSIWHVWLSAGDGFRYQGSSGWLALDGYDSSRVKRVASGDFNGDGKTDTAAFYERASGTCILHVWLSTGGAFQYQGSSGWWADSGYNGSGFRRMVAGDYNGDGKSDIAVFYDRSGTSIWHVWLSAGGGFNYQGSSGWWADSGYDPSGNKGVASGDFSGE
jgi:hypothetical protein